ncbi:MAG: DUF2927 domain-containing protein [Scytolyngbya sp. HA4215-MV1]|jgi:hypothetical protein|nr:DUF2927 domain-containing protein [Scytolyngbya sp. HA4215-MV1]
MKVRDILIRVGCLCILGASLTVPILAVANPTSSRQAFLTASNPNSKINIRTQPSTNPQSKIVCRGGVGDQVDVLNKVRGLNDSYDWYEISLNCPTLAGSQIPLKGYVREDLVKMANFLSGLSLNSPFNSHPVAARRTTYSADEVNRYFLEVALGSEYGSTNARVRKWDINQPIRIYVNRTYGTPTAADEATLNQVVNELKQLTGLNLEIVDRNPNIEIYFAPQYKFKQIEPNYRPLNSGFAWVWWSGDTITKARILVTTTNVSQKERSSIIREELTQSLGLLQDSEQYADSIFYQEWNDVTEFSAVDKAVIQLFYGKDQTGRELIRPGLTRAEVSRILWQRTTTAQQAIVPAKTPIETSTAPDPLNFSLDNSPNPTVVPTP